MVTVEVKGSMMMDEGQLPKSHKDEADEELDAELQLAYKLNGLKNDTATSRSSGVVDTGQLSIYYAGQVGVFQCVAPEKVQDAVYVLGFNGAWVDDINNAGRNTCWRKGELPGRCSRLRRLASLKRYHQKRMQRCYEKKIKYHVRQRVALRMRRSKGRFSSKKTLDHYSCPSTQKQQHTN